MSAPDREEDRDALAAEHVLGLLEGEAARRADDLEESDPGFAALVADWRKRFAEFDETAPEEMADEAIWHRIEAGIGTALRPTAPSAQGRLAGLWDSLGFWRAVGLTACAASLALAVGLAVFGARRPLPPTLVAVLLTDDNRAAALVNIGSDGRAELVPIAPVAVPAGRVLQVWTLWDRARGPVSVGLTPAPHRLALGLDALPRAVPDQLFEITLEPEGGSPTGRPTGPILMKGLAARTL